MTGLPRDIDLNALFAEEGFVRRLARGLLFDEHRVDDIVQQTWMAAMKRPPEEEGSLRAWLARVVRNLASNQVRSERRSKAREERATRPEDAPSVDELLQQEEQRREVLEALETLPQPYRDTVLARYFDDRTPQHIARSAGIPSATVRTRLRRGLEMMRDRLDAKHEGARASWALALIPLARPRAAAASLTTTGGGLLLMKGAILVGATVILVILAAQFLAGDDSSPIQQSVVAGEREPTQAVDADGEGGDADRVELALAARDVRATPEWVGALSGFRGRLVSEDGQPVAATTVRVAGLDGLTMFTGTRDLPATGESQGLALSTGDTVSANDGTFAVTGLWPRASYALRVGNDGTNAHFQSVDLSPGPGEIVDLGDIVLETRGTIVGRVVDDEGEPVAGAMVWAADIPGIVFAAAALDRLSPHDGAMIAVPTPRSADQPARDYAGQVRWYLASDLFRDVVDLDEDDYQLLAFDLPGWAREVWDVLPVTRTRTDDDGVFRLDGVVPGSNVLVARHPGLESGIKPRVKVDAGQERDVGSIRMRAGRTLSGRVIDAAGAAVAGAEVKVSVVGGFGFRGVGFAEPMLQSEADGSFEVRGLPRGRALVMARRAAGDPWVSLPPLDLDEMAVVTLPAPRSFEFSVAFEGGRAPEALTVELVEGPLLGQLSRLGLQPRIDTEERVERIDDTTWRVSDLTDGVFTLQLRAEGFAPTARMVSVPEETNVQVAMDQSAPFDVVAIDADGGPIEGCKVWVQHRGDDLPAWAYSTMPTSYGLPAWRELPSFAGYTGPDGRLRVDELAAGEAVVAVQHPAEGQASEFVRLPQQLVTLRLSGVAVIEGTLTESGTPASGTKWRVMADPVFGNAFPGMPIAPSWAQVGADGRFRLEGLPPVKYRLVAQPVNPIRSFSSLAGLVHEQAFGMSFSGFSRGDTSVTLRAGETREVNFDVDPSNAADRAGLGRIEGRILLDGSPAVGVRIRRGSGWSETSIATADSDGRFVATGISAGQVKVIISDPSGERDHWSGDVEVPAGGAGRLDLDLSTGTLSGRVLLTDGRAAANVKVKLNGRLESGGRGWATVWTDVDGRFSQPDLGVGTWVAEVRADSAAGVLADIQVTSGPASPVVVRCEPLSAVKIHLDLQVPLPEGEGLSLMVYDSADDLDWTNFTSNKSTTVQNALAAGRYTLKAYAGGKRLVVEPATFEASGESTEVRVVVRR